MPSVRGFGDFKSWGPEKEMWCAKSKAKHWPKMTNQGTAMVKFCSSSSELDEDLTPLCSSKKPYESCVPM
ncbi:hypothetical protein VNO78_15852 [Psophocarpus tetragonolobus]|uniref:Uncharacterized protein n=1 Tax=Psophocarpus tetragonolobus TaxID=3891 RepID=A0AAN9SG50_PSOTE